MDGILLEAILRRTTNFLLILFTYVIPLLSSIRTIHNRDKESYTQWLTYWLLIHLLSPLFNLLKFYKILHLSFILWLSLPRFQGATFIYNEVVDTFLDKYSVEAKVDDKIHTMKKSIKGAMWNIAKDIGWGFLYQIGGVVSFVQDSAASFVDDRNNNIDDSNGHNDNDIDNNEDSSDDLNDDNTDHNTDHNTDDNDSFNDNDEERSEEDDDIIEHMDDDDNDNHNHNETSNNPQLPVSSSVTSGGVGTPSKLQPAHSVLDSFSSLASLESLDLVDTVSIEEKEAYVADFTLMLEKGLYVFAWYNIDVSILENIKTNSTLSDDINNNTSKRFKLRVLTLYQGVEEQMQENEKDRNHDHYNDRMNSYFALSSVESSSEEGQTDIISFPASSITGVRESGTHGIQFLTTSTREPEHDDEFECTTTPTLSISQSTSEPSLTKSALLKSSTSSLLSTVSEGGGMCESEDSNGNDMTKDEDDDDGDDCNEENNVVVAEIVLSDDQDRNILLIGLRIFLS